MARCTIIFGNGLGMALNNAYFPLSAGLSSVWRGTQNFSREQKRLIISAMYGLTEQQFPQSEEALDTIHVAIVAANFLKSFESDDVSWLNDNSRELPEAFGRFIHEVATYFTRSDMNLPIGFAQSLEKFIKLTRSHVAVLNYDNILYDSFVRNKILDGYSGALIDGFRRSGFSRSNLDRYYPRKQAWFLHLHGSPLYIGQNKLMREDRGLLAPSSKSHIVLSHVKHKPLIIASSEILSEYWRRLEIAFSESEAIIIFGYSGQDIHLNEKIFLLNEGKRVFIIEWKGNGELMEREASWRSALPKCSVQVIQRDNILDFYEWAAL